MPDRRRASAWSGGGAALLGLLLAGCGAAPSTEASRPLVVPPERYPEAFDAAVAAARDAGLPPSVRDRSGGIIETEPRVAGSVLEPWRWGDETGAQVIESTLLFQRRRARIEFAPESQVAPQLADPGEEIEGPAPPGRRGGGPIDVTAAKEPIEVRVLVFVDRAFVPGLKKSAYSNTLRTTYTDPLRPNRETWTPVGRDPTWESRIRADLERRLALGAAAPPPPADDPDGSDGDADGDGAS